MKSPVSAALAVAPLKHDLGRYPVRAPSASAAKPAAAPFEPRPRRTMIPFGATNAPNSVSDDYHPRILLRAKWVHHCDEPSCG